MDNYFMKKINKKAKSTHDFANNYNYWSYYLYGRVMRLFEWSGLPFPQKELEMRLLLDGYCASIPFNNKQIVASCSLYGITEYYDEFSHLTWNTPQKSGTHKIDDNYILANNDSLRQSIIPIVNHYAIELAHTSITMVNSLVNKRADSTITATNGVTSESANNFINNLYTGKQVPLTDEQFAQLHFNAWSSGNNNAFVDCYELQRNLLGAFFECFGIATAYRKKGNMTDDEVNRNDNLLMLDINDMLKCRQEFADKLSNAINSEVTVKTLVNYKKGVSDNDN